MRNGLTWLNIDSPETAHTAIRRVRRFSVLHGLVAAIIAGFVLFEGRAIAGFDRKIVIVAVFLCFAAFRIVRGSTFWLYMIFGYETLNGLFCFVGFRYPDEFLFNLVNMGFVVVAWRVYASGMMGADYLSKRDPLLRPNTPE